MIHCAAGELRRFAAAVLEAIGMRLEDAAFAAEAIVASDLAGHESHGMRRLPEYVERWRGGRLDPAARPVVEPDAGAVVRLHGANGFGHVAVRDPTDLAAPRAREHGVAATPPRRAHPA